MYSFNLEWGEFLDDNNFKTRDILNVIEVGAMEEAGRKLIDRSKRGGFLNAYLVL